MENYNIENIVDNMIPPIQPLVESLQAKATVKLSNTNPFEIKQDGSEFAGVKTSEQLSKPSIEYRVDAREAYSEVGGEMFRNFPSYEKNIIINFYCCVFRLVLCSGNNSYVSAISS